MPRHIKSFKDSLVNIQADGSTDSTNVEDELFLALYFDAHTQDGTVHVKSSVWTTCVDVRSNLGWSDIVSEQRRNLIISTALSFLITPWILEQAVLSMTMLG